jgi:hypothetical protein
MAMMPHTSAWWPSKAPPTALPTRLGFDAVVARLVVARVEAELGGFLRAVVDRDLVPDDVELVVRVDRAGVRVFFATVAPTLTPTTWPTEGRRREKCFAR